jgi:hypothetical protein
LFLGYPSHTEQTCRVSQGPIDTVVQINKT